MKELDDTFHSLVDKDEVSYQVKTHLNEVFGKDAANLSKVVELVEELRLARDDLQQRLQFATTEAPDKITRAVRGAERALEEGDHLTRRGEGLQEQAREHFKKVSSLLQKVGPGVRKVAELKRVETYQSFVSSMEECSHDIASSLHIGAEGQALLGHSRLVEGAKAIEGTQCHHLEAFVSATLLHWNKALLHRFTSEFEGVLKSIKWPLVGDSGLGGQLPATPDSIQQLCTLTQYLLQLSLQGLSVQETPPSPSVTPAVLTNFEPLLLPIQLMLNPLEVRFLYHFTGTRATNSRSHPEWYFIQLLKWVTAHDNFLTHRIQPVLDRCGKGDVTAKPPSTAQVSGSVFDSIITLYSHIEGEMVNTLSTFVFSEVRARSLPYRRDKWHKSPDQQRGGRSVKISEVSPSVCPLLEVLARHLHTLKDCLATPLFHTLWMQVAETIDKYIYDELVLETRFTEAGAMQFKLDMTSALFPIFGEFTQRPDNYFRLIKESSILLTLPRPTVLLLQDTLSTGTTSFVHPGQALADHGVTLLSPQEATAVLNSRIYDTE